METNGSAFKKSGFRCFLISWYFGLPGRLKYPMLRSRLGWKLRLFAGPTYFRPVFFKMYHAAIIVLQYKIANGSDRAAFHPPPKVRMMRKRSARGVARWAAEPESEPTNKVNWKKGMAVRSRRRHYHRVCMTSMVSEITEIGSPRRGRLCFRWDSRLRDLLGLALCRLLNRAGSGQKAGSKE